MARHASLGRGDACEIAFFRGSVAVAAIYAQLRNVMAVAKRHRLLANNLRLSHIGGSFNCEENPGRRSNHENGAENGNL